MPSNKLTSCGIHAFYQKTAIDYMLYGFLVGYRANNPKATIDESIFISLQHFGINDNFEPENVKQIYYNLHSLFIQEKKERNGHSN